MQGFSRLVAYGLLMAGLAACLGAPQEPERFADASWRWEGTSRAPSTESPPPLHQFTVPEGSARLEVHLYYVARGTGSFLLEYRAEDRKSVDFAAGDETNLAPWYVQNSPEAGRWDLALFLDGEIDYVVGAYY